jgi:hypothetical protein|tara:strand:- start:4289 stop:4714 length:426 start_codon:yes stop_codon:yes gene_type:complete
MVFLSSCSQFDGSFLNSNDPQVEQQGESLAEDITQDDIFNQINDISFPPDTVIDIPSSLIMGSDENWFGQLFFISDKDANEVFAYFKEHMPDTGWFLIMEQQTKQSFLVYEKDNRVAILNISRNKRGSKATMAVGPRAGIN